MKRINLDFMPYLLGLLLCVSACSKDDEGSPDTNNNHMTINGQRFTITAITVNTRTDFTFDDSESWEVILADATYAPHINDDDYEGDGHGIVIDYKSQNDPIEIDTESEFTNEYRLRIRAYDNGFVYGSDAFDPNTQGLIVTVNGNNVTIDGNGYDEDNRDNTFSFYYEGPASIFN